MAWKHISDSLPAWLSAEIEKGAASAKPAASATEQRQGEEFPVAASHERMNVALRLVSSRCKSAHDPRREPPRRADFHLMLVWSDGHATAPRQQLRHGRDDAGTTRIRGSS
jgi:hypothetical protein